MIIRDSKGRFVKGSGAWHSGKKGVYSDDALLAMSRSKEGKPSWNKNKGGYKQNLSPEQRMKIAERRKNWKLSEEAKKRISIANSGENNGSWRGGVWDKKNGRNAGYPYRVFRRQVLKHSPYCSFCGSTERLEMDHIKPYSVYPELRMEISNVRVLCHECHKSTETYGLNVKKYVGTN